MLFLACCLITHFPASWLPSPPPYPIVLFDQKGLDKFSKRIRSHSRAIYLTIPLGEPLRRPSRYRNRATTQPGHAP